MIRVMGRPVRGTFIGSSLSQLDTPRSRRFGGPRKTLTLLAGAGQNDENADGSVVEKGWRAILLIDVE